jgi:hypothetical protein
MKKIDTKGGKVTNDCGCSPKDTNMHKLQAMGYKPKFEKPSPKTPA